LGLATLVMANTEALTAIMFMTFGFGFPLIFVGTVFAYALCARPAILALSGPVARRVRGVVLSAVAMMALAVLPGFAGRTQASLGPRLLSANDHVPAKPPAPQSLEIRRPASIYDRTFKDTAACGPECRAVLSAGPVSWVRVVMLGSPDSSTVFRRSE